MSSWLIVINGQVLKITQATKASQLSKCPCVPTKHYLIEHSVLKSHFPFSGLDPNLASGLSVSYQAGQRPTRIQFRAE
jgi:hypothetical protein